MFLLARKKIKICEITRALKVDEVAREGYCDILPEIS
jgi:hypothetical protein